MKLVVKSHVGFLWEDHEAAPFHVGRFVQQDNP
jgi:hypothetical protein